MGDTEEYSTESLQRCSYRFLQKTAKALGLPSNVKKIYLIQLIHCKKYCGVDEVENLVKQVRLERQQLALVRKRSKSKKKHEQQSAEISSTCNSKSPPITATPKRVSHVMIRYSPDQYTPPKRVRRPPNRTIAHTAISASDRVLRSFRSIRSVKNPNYVINNGLIGIIKNSSSEESIKSIGRVTASKKDKYQQVNMASLVRKRTGWRNGNEIVAAAPKKGWGNEVVPAQRQRSTNMSPQPVRQQRRLSGIYPLNNEVEQSNVLNVSIRRADGTLSKLNAYIQKPQQNYTERESQPCIKSTERDTRATNVSTEENFQSKVVSDMSSENNFDNLNEETLSNTSNFGKDNQEEYTMYYHKKIRAEQVRSLRSKDVESECKLPKINDVFSKFSMVYNRDVTQPLYVQVDHEPEIAQNQPYIYPDLQTYQASMLETLYNLKNVFIVNQPLLQITTTSNTRCVYSTPIICTAKAQPSANVSSVYNLALTQDSPQYCMDDPRVHDFFRNFRCEEEAAIARRSSSPTESLQSQDLGANVTIPEMVEDALELISQDGDYMERMGMDVRMQCVLCDWAGPKIILEYHIRKEHPSDLVTSRGGTWRAVYSLGTLSAARSWCCAVLDARAHLLVLRAKYEDPDTFCAALATLAGEDDSPTTGSITTYHKVTGEPFTWKGIIPQLPSTLSYEENPDCLKLELSKMNLLPNSANLKLLNRELVGESPTKVVVGQPELDNINISLVIKLYE